MRSHLQKIVKRFKSDRADSELVSLLILLPLLLGLLLTMVDVATYFNDRSIIQSSARDGARTVAIMGGNGTASQATPIENKYGVSKSSACSGFGGNAGVIKNFGSTSNNTAIECQILKALSNNSGLVSVEIRKVYCTPTESDSIGARTTCTIEWDYGSIPGSTLGFIHVGYKHADGTPGNSTTGTSETEVNMSGIPLQARA